jgi:predicted RNase H-like HicB family nuclease
LIEFDLIDRDSVDYAFITRTEGLLMQNVYNALIKQDGDWWIGWIEEVPGVNCQETSRDELLESLKVTLQEALEFNRQDAVAAAGSNYQEERIAV